jgi:hypothetical protein
MFRVESQVVSLSDLGRVPEGTEITPETLVEAGVIRARKGQQSCSLPGSFPTQSPFAA